jgi:hypothetical protein
VPRQPDFATELTRQRIAFKSLGEQKIDMGINIYAKTTRSGKDQVQIGNQVTNNKEFMLYIT